MMAVQLDSFVSKFRQLWKDGLNADLSVKSVAGNATISLSVSLDNGSGMLGRSSCSAGNARDRRRTRRAAERNVNHFTENITNIEISDLAAETKIDEKKLNEHAEFETLNLVDTEEVDGVVGNKLDDSIVHSAEDKITEKVVCSTESVSFSNAVKSKTSCKGLSKEARDMDLVEHSENPRNDLVQIKATLQIFSKRKAKLTKLEFDRMRGVLHNKEHLCRNITEVDFESHQSYRDTVDGGFMHLVPAILDVSTKHLWESAQSYVYHNLGRQSWTLDEDSSLKLIRIHEKT